MNLPERLHAAFAEAGYPEVRTGWSEVHNSCWIANYDHVPIEVRWRAWQVSGASVCCLACFTHNSMRNSHVWVKCETTTPFDVDCGAER